MKLLQAKLAKYDAPQKAKAAGVYPYFRKIESDALVLVSLMAPSTSTLPWKIDWLNSSEKTKPLFTLPVFRLILVLLHV